MGDSPQIFKPGMPVTAYLVASFRDGSPLSENSLRSSYLQVSAIIEKRGGGRIDIAPKQLPMMTEQSGVWQYHLDLKRELGTIHICSATFDGSRHNYQQKNVFRRLNNVILTDQGLQHGNLENGNR